MNHFCRTTSFVILITLFSNLSSAQTDLSERREVRLGLLYAFELTNRLNYFLVKHGYGGPRYFVEYNSNNNKIYIYIGPQELYSYDEAKRQIDRVRKALEGTFYQNDLDQFTFVAKFKQNRTLIFENGKYSEI